MAHQIKTVGTNGQFSLGKAFAGKTVLIEEITKGTWLIKTGSFIPDSEQWLHRKEDAASLVRGLAWAETNAPIDNFEQQIKKLSTHGNNKN